MKSKEMEKLVNNRIAMLEIFTEILNIRLYLAKKMLKYKKKRLELGLEGGKEKLKKLENALEKKRLEGGTEKLSELREINRQINEIDLRMMAAVASTNGAERSVKKVEESRRIEEIKEIKKIEEEIKFEVLHAEIAIENLHSIVNSANI
jgi:hypothetical protein